MTKHTHPGAVAVAKLARDAENITRQALATLRVSAAEHQRVTHAKHIPERFHKAIDLLEIQLAGETALATKQRVLATSTSKGIK